MKINKKLSAKTVIGTQAEIKKIAEEAKGKSVPLMRVVGWASSVRKGESNYGEWTSLRGEFGVINLVTSEEKAGSELFLPDVLVNLFEGEIGNNTRIKVDATVFVKKSDTATGYEYEAELNRAPEESDPIGELLAVARSEVKQLTDNSKQEKAA